MKKKLRQAFTDLKMTVRTKTAYYYNKIETEVMRIIADYQTRYNALSDVKKNRTIVLVLSLVIISDYLMISFHTGHNPFDIFPSIPVLDMRDKVTIYVPSPDGTLLKETRLVQKGDDREIYAKRLVRFVTSGSAYENTRPMTPIQGNVRKIWISGGICVVDFWLETLDDDAPVVVGSENLFRDAVKKTLMANIKGIKDVIVLENGIPGKNIWEATVAQSSQTPENTSQAGPVINK